MPPQASFSCVIFFSPTDGGTRFLLEMGRCSLLVALSSSSFIHPRCSFLLVVPSPSLLLPHLKSVKIPFVIDFDESVTNGATNATEPPTNKQTDKASCRDAGKHLKNGNPAGSTFFFSVAFL